MSVTIARKAAPGVRRLLRRVATAAREWRRERSGSALVEFAMAMPLLVAMLVGAVEMAALVAAKGRAADTAMTVGDLVTKNRVMDEVRIKDLFMAADALLEAGVMHAADGSKAEVIVTSALSCTCADNPNKLCFTSLWSHKYAGGKIQDGYASEEKLPQMPSTLAFAKDETIVMTEVKYKYVAPVQMFLDSAAYEYTDTAYHRPRFSTFIEHTGAQAAASRRTCP